MKQKLIISLMSIAIIGILGSTIAAFVASTPVREEVSTASLGIDIIQIHDEHSGGKELEDGENGESGFQYTGVPGDVIKERIAVINTDSRPCYVRVTINRSWVDDNSKKIFEANNEALDPADIGIVTSGGKWDVKVDPADPEVIYCYYKEVLDAGATSDDVMESFSILADKISKNSNHYSKLTTKISFEADGIQTTAAKDAMLAEWGIIADIDENGTILQYQEQ